MEKKSLLQYFREEAGTEQKFAERIVKVLSENDICTIDYLMAKSDEDLFAIKGIGPSAIRLIGQVKTKEAARREDREKAYQKQCRRCPPITLADWFRQLDVSNIHAKKLERILTRNGIKTVDIFMETSQAEIGSWKGIGPKYLQICFQAKGLIEKYGHHRKK